jgi:ketosteroid isomerase-like protein
MSQENVDTWRRAIQAWNERDIEGVIAEFDPDVEFLPLIAGVTNEPYRGEQGVRDFVAAVDEEFEFFVTDPNRFEDHGDVVVAVAEMHAKGRVSGAEVRRPSIHVARFLDGKVVWWQTFATRDEALEAVGLSE